jgi:hypothetical protein
MRGYDAQREKAVRRLYRQLTGALPRECGPTLAPRCKARQGYPCFGKAMTRFDARRIRSAQTKCGGTVMKHISMIVLTIAAAILPAVAQDQVPEAYRPPAVGDSYVPNLSDIMGAAQLRHLKLWYAGKLRNWDLASFELGEIKDSFYQAARLYRNIPIEKIVMIEQSLAAVDTAVKARDGARFANAFTALTATCNGCHQSANVGFITIRIPTASPFTNQLFAPKGK